MTGVNIHGGLGVCNDPIWNGKFQRYRPFCAANKAYELAQVYKAMPIYHGLWMARQMGPGQDGPTKGHVLPEGTPPPSQRPSRSRRTYRAAPDTTGMTVRDRDRSR